MSSVFVLHDPVEGTIRVELVATKRSPNAFILWSRHRRSSLLLASKKMAEVSQQQGAQWNALPEEQKQPFQRAAKMAREAHKRAFPNEPYHKAGKRSKKQKKEAAPQQPQQPAAPENFAPSVSPPNQFPQPPTAPIVQYAPEYPAAPEYSVPSVSPPYQFPPPPTAPVMQYEPGYWQPYEGEYCYPQYSVPAAPVQQPMREEPAQYQDPNPAYGGQAEDWFWPEYYDASPPQQQQPQISSQQDDVYDPYLQMDQYY